MHKLSGGYVDLNKPSFNTTDHSFCGVGYDDAITKCSTHCPSGNLNYCPMGEICFTKTSCDAGLLTIAPHGPTPTQEPTTPSPVVADSKLNKYYCGYDWKDAQSRCEIWCPSGSDDDCPADQLCMAFTECHAVINGGKTLKQIEKAKTQQETAVVAGDGDGSVGGVACPLLTQYPDGMQAIEQQLITALFDCVLAYFFNQTHGETNRWQRMRTCRCSSPA